MHCKRATYWSGVASCPSSFVASRGIAYHLLQWWAADRAQRFFKRYEHEGVVEWTKLSRAQHRKRRSGLNQSCSPRLKYIFSYITKASGSLQKWAWRSFSWSRDEGPSYGKQKRETRRPHGCHFGDLTAWKPRRNQHFMCSPWCGNKAWIERGPHAIREQTWRRSQAYRPTSTSVALQLQPW